MKCALLRIYYTKTRIWKYYKYNKTNKEIIEIIIKIEGTLDGRVSADILTYHLPAILGLLTMILVSCCLRDIQWTVWCLLCNKIIEQKEWQSNCYLVWLLLYHTHGHLKFTLYLYKPISRTPYLSGHLFPLWFIYIFGIVCKKHCPVVLKQKFSV